MGQVAELEKLFWGQNKDTIAEKRIMDDLKMLYFPDLGLGAYHGIFSPNTPDSSKILWDMIQCIRYKIAWHRNPEGGITVDFGSPLRSGTEPFPIVNIKET
jgi:hypothetical protein